MSGTVVDIHEWAQDQKVTFQVSPFSKFYSNSGIYVLDIQSLSHQWSDKERVGKLEQGLLRSLARRNALFAYQNGDRYLIDLGTPERLSAARAQINTISRFFTV
jgi:NDP-sugar pyrophosphorylase family protein